MLSTYTTYRLQSQDFTRTMTRVAAEPQPSHDAAYFKANIGSVKTVDDFLKNPRLYNFAMQAYGLQDMAFGTAFMRKVLTSDLTDTASFANTLSDKRYAQFARAFNFSTSTAGANVIDIQDDTQAKDTLNLYSAHESRIANTAASETSYFKSTISSITSVDALLANTRLRTYVLAAVGLDPATSDNLIKQVLSGDTSAIPANASGAALHAWQDLAKAFSFQSDGTVAAGSAQTTSQQTTLTGFYAMQVNGGVTQAGADAATTYFKDNIGSVTSVADLVSDPRLSSYVLTAFGLDPTIVSTNTLTKILESDKSDPNSYANTSGVAGFKSLAQAFNFNADGSLPAGSSAQTTAQQDSVTSGYQSNYDSAQKATDTAATTYFKSHVTTVKNIDQLTSDHRMFAYLVAAYDLDPSTTPAKLKQALQTNPTDPTSKLTGSATTGLKALAGDFNFDAAGNVTAHREVQSYKNTFGTISAYTSVVAADPKRDAAAAKTESTYFQTTIAKVQTLTDLLADKRLVAYLAKAYSLPANMSDAASLKKILTSDINDSSSLINQPGNENLRTMSVAFNFDKNGAVVAQATTQAQFAKDTPVTTTLYMQQQLEQEVGANSEGARLALYFHRMAPNIHSAYDILADKALLQVVRSALDIPAASSSSDIQAQANTITQKLNFSDFRDPEKLDKFISRFSALYDLSNQNAQQDPVVSLFSGTTDQSNGFDSLLTSLQNFKSPG